ncbi:MAG TPA: hypothetical protein VN681_07675 [Stellaceae bacterium]|nr:hypothetical protein [Stellaceae bacterium]
MPSSSLRLKIAAIVLLAGLAACDTAPPRPTYPDIHFTSETPIRLAVSAIDVRNDYKPTFRSPHVEHLFPVPPAQAAENWAHDRLQAAGGGAVSARFTIQDASVIETPLPKKSEGISGAFKKEATERYDATLRATLEIVDARGFALRTVSAKVARSQSVLEGITPNERDQTWYDMTKALMADFDQQMSAEISGNLGGYFQ